MMVLCHLAICHADLILLSKYTILIEYSYYALVVKAISALNELDKDLKEEIASF